MDYTTKESGVEVRIAEILQAELGEAVEVIVDEPRRIESYHPAVVSVVDVLPSRRVI